MGKVIGKFKGKFYSYQLQKEAEAFVVMQILHHYGITGEYKSILRNKEINSIGLNIEVKRLLNDLQIAEASADNAYENNLNPKGIATQKKSLINIRVFQNKLRERILNNYNNQCAICTINKADLLICSHIIPWSYDVHNRLNLKNSICFCALHDKLFDKGYFTLNDNFDIILSNRIDETLKFFFRDSIFKKPHQFPPDKDFLQLHREEIFK